jgi:hypothetical protein
MVKVSMATFICNVRGIRGQNFHICVIRATRG